MKGFLSKIFKVLACMALVANTAHAQEALAPMTISAKADSTILIMGDRTTLTVEVVKNGHEGALIDMPKSQTEYHGLEVVDCVIDSADLGNDRIQLRYRITLQAFDPNDLLTLPPFRYAVGTDTVASENVTFKVLPVELSPELGDPNDIENLGIHPDENTVTIKARWYDYVPNWIVWVILALALIGICVAVYLLYKKNGPKLFVPRKPVPPYEKAIEQLKKLRAKGLIEKGLAKQYFTEVTDIWRTYLDGRFGIQAMEMTSKQIIHQLRTDAVTRPTAKDMEQILEISDFVKFAAHNPSRDDMTKAYNTIYDFVESTRPLPEPEEDEKKNADKK